LVLIETACEEVVAADHDSFLVLVLAHHDALDLAAAFGIERGAVMEKVDQDGRDKLLACPSAHRFHVCWRNRENLVVGQTQVC
jgi:hypothetical protein